MPIHFNQNVTLFFVYTNLIVYTQASTVSDALMPESTVTKEFTNVINRFITHSNRSILFDKAAIIQKSLQSTPPTTSYPAISSTYGNEETYTHIANVVAITLHNYTQYTKSCRGHPEL